VAVDAAEQRQPQSHVEGGHRSVAQADDEKIDRHQRGDDIDAACGQLRLKTERELQALAMPPK